jgi:hypothetical protein
MDIRHYTIALDVDPVQKTINGYTEITLNLLEPSNICCSISGMDLP